MLSNSIITNSVYEGVNRKKPIRRVKPLKCYNGGQPLPKVEPTVAPVINTSEVVKSSVTLLKGDCLEKMKGIPDKSIGLIICDLPFGCLSAKPLVIPNTENKYRKGCPATDRNGCSWDIPIDLEVFWKQVKRIRKDDHTPCLMFCNTKFGYDLIKSNEKEYRTDLVWNKQRGVSFLSANKSPMKSHEMIYVFSKLGAKYNRIDEEGKCVLSVINFKNTSKGGHPTEKPIELYKWLIERYSLPENNVLDPTFGSANSGLACKELNRSYIGIEMNDNFFWKAASKII
jgi:site-specific DNA-methyltransferase (adenine-specific)